MATSSQTVDKVKFESLVNATIKVNNSTDTNRTYAIEANVTIRNNEVETIDSGIVNAVDNMVMLASFSKYSGGGLNVNFTPQASESDQCTILASINGFIADAKSKITSSPNTLASL